MQNENAGDLDKLGEVGFLSSKLEGEFLFWKIVCDLKMPLEEVEKWTLSEMRLANAYNQMQNDYKQVWQKFYELESERKNG